MALVKAGDPLTSKFLQAGSVYSNDGYGLMTASATYIVNQSIGGTAVTTGQVHPIYSDFFVHKFSFTRGPLEMDTISADYVGINAAVGSRTLPNVTASHGLTSEHITTHPNFFGPATGFATAIAGNGTTFTSSTIVEGEKVGGIYGAHFKGTTTNAGGFTASRIRARPTSNTITARPITFRRSRPSPASSTPRTWWTSRPSRTPSARPRRQTASEESS